MWADEHRAGDDDAARTDPAAEARGRAPTPATGPDAEPRAPRLVPSPAKFLGRLSQLDLDALGNAVHAWRSAVAASSDAWFAAEESVARAITSGRHHDEQEVLLRHITDLFRRGPWFKPDAPGARIGAVEASGQYVATTAMLAVLVYPEIEAREFELLYHPFARLVPVSELGRE
jgi:hypothetical protein